MNKINKIQYDYPSIYLINAYAKKNTTHLGGSLNCYALRSLPSGLGFEGHGIFPRPKNMPPACFLYGLSNPSHMNAYAKKNTTHFGGVLFGGVRGI
ncbi:MAG: hypothetical protein IJW94_06440 [Oscillospiraceae bacterium]|nr:hypothetical protein [Oscillospiraceae bacterium]